MDMFKFLTKRSYDRRMNGDPTKGIEDIVRRNVAALQVQGQPHPAGPGRRDAASGYRLDT